MILKVPSLLWLWCLIAVVVILLIVGLVLLIIKKNKHKKIEKQEQEIIDSYYLNIIDSVGGIDNIVNVEALQSRLSFYLKDQSLLDSEKLKEIHINGIVKTSKKITLVVGEMATKYAKSIQEKIEQGGNK